MTTITECPYCHDPVEPTDDKRFVNGIKPATENFIPGKGCEFCCPEETCYGIYNLDGEGLATITAHSKEEAIKEYKATSDAQTEGLWAEELDA